MGKNVYLNSDDLEAILALIDNWRTQMSGADKEYRELSKDLTEKIEKFESKIWT